MAVHTFVRSRLAHSGPQPFDPGRHMIQVANLVGQVFAAELDRRGRSTLREMRLVGRFSPVLGGMLSMALFSEAIFGQVWEEDGRVVGNVTLQNADQSGSRWRISNVAVAPEWRGRGIARSLMQATVQEIAQRGGSWAVLQVYAENRAAYELYRSLRFEDIMRSTAWRLPIPPRRPLEKQSGIEFEPLRGRMGAEWLALTRAAHSNLAQWVDPVRAVDYEMGFGQLLREALGRATGVYTVTRWGVRRAGRLVAVVETRAQPFAEHDTLRMDVHPEARGELEAVLLAQGLASLARPDGLSVQVEHDGEHREALAALQAAGFHLQRDLITMRRAISPADGRI